MMKNNLIDNMLKWANDRIGETKYAGTVRTERGERR